MKKRILACVLTVALIFTVCFSVMGAVGDEEVTTYEGLYDLYANGGTYGTESVGISNMEMMTNAGADATVIGGNFGVTTIRPSVSEQSIVMKTATTMGNDIIDPIEGSTVKYFGNGVGKDNPNSSNQWGFYSPKASDTMGGTVVLNPNIASFKMYMFCAHPFDDNGEMKFYVSSSSDSGFREISVKRSDNTEWTHAWHAYIYEPADVQQIQPTDKFLKFVFTKPRADQGDHVYQVAVIKYTCNNTYNVRSVEFDEVNIKKIMPYMSDDIKIIKSGSLNTALSPRVTNLRFKDTTVDDTTMEAIFTSDINELNFDIKDIKFHVSQKPDVVFAAPKISVCDTLNGTYEDVAIKTTVTDETTWCKSYIYSFEDFNSIKTKDIRYVKFTSVVPGGVQNPHYTLSYVEMFYEPKTVDTGDETAYTGSIAYRTTNMTGFDAQFNFKASAAEKHTIKAYVAQTNREDAYREINLTRREGKLETAPVPTTVDDKEAWVSYLYSPAEGEELGDYIKFEIISPSSTEIGDFQFMGLAYTYDDSQMKIFNIKDSEGEKPIRAEGYINVKNPVPEALGGKRSYQLYQVEEGTMVYNARNLENFRAFFSTNSTPADIDIKFYVSSKDVDELYTPIDCKFETGFRSGSWKNYVFTPYNPEDIPIGSNYLKIVGKSTTGHNLMLLEADVLDQVEKSQTMEQCDLSSATLSNLQDNGDGTLSVIDTSKEASLIVPTENATWFKSGITFSKDIAADATVTHYMADSEDGTFTEINTHTFDSQGQTSGFKSLCYEPEEKDQATLGNYIKIVISPLKNAAGSVKVDFVEYHHSLITVPLPEFKEHDEETLELMDTFDSENLTTDNGGMAHSVEMLQWGQLTYGYEETEINAIYRIDPDVDAYIDYKTDNPISYFDVRALRNSDYSDTELIFYVSADGEYWEEIDPQDIETIVEKYEGSKEGVAYRSINVPNGMYYLRIEFPVLQSANVAEIALTGVQIHSPASYSPETGDHLYDFGNTNTAAVAGNDAVRLSIILSIVAIAVFATKWIVLRKNRE